MEAESLRFHCIGCGRVIDGAGLRPGERFKCAKCKKLMTLGPSLFDPRTRENWQLARLVVLVSCIAATVWCVTIGYGFGARSGSWLVGFGGSIVVWLVAVGCIALAARTTQNNGVLVGVTALMAGVSLFFIERLGEEVGYDVAAWRQFQSYGYWVPGLIGCGLGVLAAALVVQARRRAL